MNLDINLENLEKSLDRKMKEKNFDFFSRNSKTSQALESFLYKVIEDDKLHACWLNTLSFLEHIGSRKILKSQDSTTIPLMVLEHAAEETRHAYFFKKLSHKVSKNDFCYNFEEKFMIEGKKGEEYFQFLDHFVEKDLKNLASKKQSLFLNYLYTTWLVEKRALWLYEIYSDILKEKSFSFHLKPVLLDEDKHLRKVEGLLKEKDPHFFERSFKFSLIEETQFNYFLSAIYSFAFK